MRVRNLTLSRGAFKSFTYGRRSWLASEKLSKLVRIPRVVEASPSPRLPRKFIRPGGTRQLAEATKLARSERSEGSEAEANLAAPPMRLHAFFSTPEPRSPKAPVGNPSPGDRERGDTAAEPTLRVCVKNGPEVLLIFHRHGPRSSSANIKVAPHPGP
jgi:hypothetical protein